MSKEVFNLIIAISYLLLFAGVAVFLSWMTIQRKKNIALMSANIKEKLTSGISLSAKELVFIGRGFDLSAKASRDIAYKLFAYANENSTYLALKALVSDIEKEEPFDELPEEVKPSLARLTKLIEAAGNEADKHILSPLTATLRKYVDLKAEQEKAKKQTNRAYVITIISFVIGAISFYFTLRSPGEPEIKRAIEQALIEKKSENLPSPQ